MIDLRVPDPLVTGEGFIAAIMAAWTGTVAPRQPALRPVRADLRDVQPRQEASGGGSLAGAVPSGASSGQRSARNRYWV